MHAIIQARHEQLAAPIAKALLGKDVCIQMSPVAWATWVRASQEVLAASAARPGAPMMFLGNPEFGCDLAPVDFAQVAHAMGMHARRVAAADQCAAELEEVNSCATCRLRPGATAGETGGGLRRGGGLPILPGRMGGARMKFASALVATLLCAFAGMAQAHHGISNWDLNKDITLTGHLTQIELINPHSWIHLEVRGADGRTSSWKCEMRSVNALRRSGWTREMFRIGSTITVTGSPERRKPDQCYLATILFADGSRMDRYGQRQLAVAQAAPVPARRATRTADGRPNFAGEWAAEQRVMSDPRGQLGTLVPLSEAGRMKPGDVPGGQGAFPGARGSPASLAADPVKAAWDRPIPVQLTAQGRRAVQAFDPASTDNPRLRCEPTSIIFDWTFDSVVNRIEQTPARITLRYGHMDLAREIHLDGKAAPASLKPSRAGYSVGRWDGNVLVVETTGFSPGVLNADSRILHGTRLKVIERFELDATGTRLTRSFVAEDPEYFAGSWSGSDVVLPADVPYAPYACRDPGGAPSGR